MKITAVSLQMDNAALLEKITVTVHEQRCSQPLLLAADLRVSESDPYLGNLSRSKKRLDELYTGAQESDIIEAMLFSVLRSFPKTGPLDIHAYIIEGRISLCQIDSIVSLAASKFKNYRLIISEEVSSPVPLQRMVATKHLRCRRLHHAPERLILPELS